MINAKEAAAQSAENKQTNAIKDVEESIKKAIKKGRTEIAYTCTYDLIDPVTEVLTNAGYTVKQIQGGIKVYWG